jgi:hypothetical protein
MSEPDKKEEREQEDKKPEPEKVEMPAEKQANIALDKGTEDMWTKLNNMANEESRAFFEYLMTNDQYEFNGTTYKYKMINRKNMGQLIKLRTEAIDLNKTEDFEKYSDNIMKRACIVIQDMTPEKFDADDYELLENLTVAWSLKDRGFRKFKQGPRSVL